MFFCILFEIERSLYYFSLNLIEMLDELCTMQFFGSIKFNKCSNSVHDILKKFQKPPLHLLGT